MERKTRNRFSHSILNFGFFLFLRESALFAQLTYEGQPFPCSAYTLLDTGCIYVSAYEEEALCKAQANLLFVNQTVLGVRTAAV